jgi:hypothetical protein
MLTDKPTGKRPIGRPRRRWEDNIRMDLEEIGIYAGNWVGSSQDRDYWGALVNVVLTFGFHKPWSELAMEGKRLNSKNNFINEYNCKWVTKLPLLVRQG